MTLSLSWGWGTLFLLGAYHGINPGMGWLFAVALGMQENSTRAVVRSMAPIALGHAVAIGAVIVLAGVLQIAWPEMYVKVVVAGALFSLGVYRIVRRRHFRWVGMQVGFRELTLWSFLMASAHGAGLMVLPVVMKLPPAASSHRHGVGDPMTGIWATLIHTLGYLLLTAAIALLVYRKLGLALLRKAWFNLDLLWALALIVTAVVALWS